nr:MAG TPA: hypothetical protein [Bacteriophage sp.]
MLRSFFHSLSLSLEIFERSLLRRSIGILFILSILQIE